MPQTVTIQTEMMSPVSARKAAKAGEQGGQEMFASHLNQQVEQGQKNQSTAKSGQDSAPKAATEAASTEEQDTDLAADGNNLPSDQESVSEADTEQAEATDNEKPNGELEAAESDAETVAEQAPVQALPAVDASADNAKAGDKQADKPIRAQVSVSQQAVDHAKAAPVEMTAKAQPQQKTESEAPAKPATASNTEQKTAQQAAQQTALKNDFIKVEVSTETEKSSKQADKTVVPNLAAVMKEEVESEAKPPKLRADILDALQRQQSKQETGMTVRNLIATQTQQVQAETKATISLPNIVTDKLAADQGTTPLSSPTTFSSPMSSGQSGTPSAAAQTTVSLPVQPNMQNPAWGQVMSSRVVYMAKEGVQQAELRMNPANLGPVEVRLHVQNDQASVTFHAQHSATRDALEQALPRLRESFAESGLQLANAQVGEQQQQHQEQPEQANQLQIFAQASRQDDDIDNETVTTVSSAEAATGLSLYA